jgi:type VI secretion system secreted protein VgrG
MEIYDHHSPFLFPKWSFANDEAPRMLRQERRRASIATAVSGCSDLAPGRRFALAGHPASQLDGPWVVVAVEHRGETHGEAGRKWNVYESHFECAPAEMTYPPPRPPRECAQVALTATVVGPPGEEIWVDPIGRIKVQFHWDREGRYDDRSSCWIRVMQPWAGAAWGHQFIPRVGQEVIVLFEAGDPDRPLVTGAVYNGTHPPPFKLPENRTRSGIRTQSSPGGHGFNELSFEDAAGREQIYLHAQRDHDELVERNQSSHVRGARSVEVELSSTERVGHDASLAVGDNARTSIGADEQHDVGRHWQGKIGGNRALEVKGEATLTVMMGHSMEVRGNRALMVGTSEKPAQSDHYVHGSASLGAADGITLRAEKSIVLACGESTIEVGPEKIVLKAAAVEISPKKTLECSTKDGPSMTLGEDVEILSKKLRIFTESGALEIDKEFKAKGDKIKLGYDPSKPDRDEKDEKPETAPFSVKLSSYFLTAYANKKYHLMVDGLRFEGETDGAGVVKQDIPKSARQVVVRLWLDAYPEGRQVVYTMKVHEELPPIDSVRGAKTRLKNLGYYRGSVSDTADEPMRDAVMEFQRDHGQTHGLEQSGELDAGTRGALEEVHGS